MTPIRGLLKKILGGGSDSPPPAAPSEPRSTRSAAPPPGEMASDDAEREPRRRGSRGGRGRGGSGSAPAATTETLAPSSQRTSTGVRLSNSGAPATASADTAPRSYAWGSRGNDDQTRQRREQASRQRRPATRSFRPLRENLDAPLPEDIAFRAPAEGGDPSILPARRRRPTGLHDTARVLVGGARSLAGWARPFGTTLDPVPVVEEIAPVEPEPPRAALLEAIVPGDGLTGTATADSLIETDEDGENRAEIDLDDAAGDLATAPRRRRGRRGGRGRRRPGTEAGASETPELDEDQPDVRDDVDDFVPPAATLPSPVEEVPADLDEELDDTPVAAPEHEAIREAPRAVRRPRGATAPAIDPADYPAAFAALGVGETTLQALARFGFANPTPIQERAIPALLEGKDVVGVAQTGSGKTIAFGVPMAESLDPDLAEVQGIVLVPTRELAQQVLEVLQDLAAPWGLEAIGILGGHSLASDFKALERRPAIVVGTPGRVIDHLERGTLSLRYVHYAVLDEADQMLDIGFLPAIRRILSRTPRNRQTALFSATMPSTIRRLIWQFMQDPETVTVDPELSTVDTIEQIYYEVAARDKSRGLRELVERELKGRTLVFCKMKRSVDRLEQDLSRQGVRVGALHGDMDQRHRDRVVQDFRGGELDVLIATNVAARGLDIPEITHVVNYDVPQNPEEYVHRIGRTGRAGRDGKAITFVSEWDMGEWDAITASFPEQIRQEHLDLYSR